MTRSAGHLPPMTVVDRRGIAIGRFREALEALTLAFPWLAIEIDRNDPEIDARALLGTQSGLDFDVEIVLQNRDELHLSAGHFWVEWFPCGDQEVFDRFLEAVIGLVSGRFRIVESYLFNRAVEAELQAPTGENGWRKVASWANLGFLVPWKRTRRILQNRTVHPGPS